MDSAEERSEEVQVEAAVEAVDEAVSEDAVDVSDEQVSRATEETQSRAMAMEIDAVDEEARTAMIALSSEEPVKRNYGVEVLEHSESAMDLEFMRSGRAPLLLDHDHTQVIGVIESVDLDGESRRLRAKVRFGRSALAREAFDDVVDGIRTNVSIGYSIDKLERGSNKDEYVARSWRPVEGSLVSVPADPTVGLGRSAEEPQKPVIRTDFQKENTMSEVDIAAVEAEARKAAQKDAAKIIELGAAHSRSDLAAQAVKQGRSIEEFRGELLEVIGSERSLHETNVGLTDKEVKRFSIVRAINALANPTDKRAQEAAAFEIECSAAASQAYGRASEGIMLPADVLRNWSRDLSAGVDTAVLTEDFRGGDFIDVLRNQSSVMQAGARMLNGLQSDVAIPKKLTASSAAWLNAEGDDVTQTEPTFGQVTLSPKDIGAYTQVTRRMLQQSTLDIEAVIRDDLATAIALGMDLAALRGNGTSGSPTGIKSTAGINSVDFGVAPITVPSYAKVVEMETAIAEDNALMGNLAYILPASMVGGLKTTEKATGTAQFVYEPGGTLNGYRAINSNQVEAGDLYFGNFQDLLIGMWGGLDLQVDPYTNGLSGTMRVRVIQTMDVAVRHAVSFCLGNDGGS
jgi:HK97 family phage major capsid protein